MALTARGGRGENNYLTPLSNIVELKDKIMNLLSKQNSDLKDKTY